jgi:hypothetical protein
LFSFFVWFKEAFYDTNDCCIDFSSPFPCLTAAAGCKLGTRRATWQHASGCGSAGPTFVSPSFFYSVLFFFYFIYLFFCLVEGRREFWALGLGCDLLFTPPLFTMLE